MSMIRKLRVKFICVFMGLMLAFSVAVGAFLYLEQRAELNYQCMVYLLDIHNAGNKEMPSAEQFLGYPPFFVLEIDNMTDTAEVVEGRFFLSEQGVTTDELIARLVGNMEESGVLKEYQVRFFNGVREDRGHRVSFIDVSYIQDELRALLGRIILFEVPILLLLLLAAVPMSRWFSRPATQAMDEQRRFISKVSHELKTPVSIVRANIDLIDGGRAVDEADFLFGCDNIRHECDRMTNLIEAMLYAALPAQAQGNTEIDLTTLLQRETLRFEVVAFDQGLTLTLEAEDGLTVMGDAVQITRLVDIIVENAIKYCAPGGSITVTASRRPGLSRRARIVCANTGEGLTKEQMENIFKPFYQVDATKKGAGLGLAIAHEIVQSMNGTIEAGCADGQTRFIIEI